MPDPLNIALVCAPWRLPRRRYSGTERVVDCLARKLNNATIFAGKGTKTTARLVSVPAMRDDGPLDLSWIELTLFNLGKAYKMGQNGKFCLIHDHTGIFGLATAAISPIPVAMTLHGPFTELNSQMYAQLTGPHIVTISDSQKSLGPKNVRDSATTVYNGLDLEDFPFGPDDDGSLLFVGRISEEKGTHLAIDVAQALNMPLKIAAKLAEVDRPYFAQYIQPRLKRGKVTWLGEVTEHRRNRLMMGARAVLHTATWNEPFGLVMIEAMACGAPVIGFNRGSVPEIVEHGRTGFVVEDVEEMLAAVRRLHTISRPDCREHAIRNFSSERMARDYKALYQQMLAA
ncbi:MAG: glycosyl transferase group 1 [Candidatus Saccharibacteria bacterium]|nr:glycosyl transferase group 1 [Candidatus Saccharibacteria bacterium]